jgi:osmoprotectant transport system permease protein
LFEAITAYFQQYSWTFLDSLLQHIMISGISILIAAAIGIPLGIFSSRSERLYRLFTAFFGLLRVIPSLALLFIFIPILGVGVLPAVVALVILALPPVLINTAISFRTLPESVLETAVGMGMDSRMIFFRVKLPLALPLVLTGIRTGTVEIIASATLAAYIGAGGLGQIIFTGLGLYRMDLLFIGGVSVAALSLLADLLLSVAETVASRHVRA